MNTQAYEVKQARRAALAAALREKFPQLVSCEGKCGCVTAAKNIRIELKAAFPGVKFSVKTRKFSMGDAIDVSWTDGPTSAQVDAIIDKYSGGHFDGMTDCYEYSRSTWTDAFGDAKYVHSHRNYSDEIVGRVIKRVAERFGAQPITVEDYNKGAAWNWRSEGGCDLGRELNSALHRHTCSLTVKTFDEPTECEEPTVATAAGGVH